ncbi:hypothetical protein ACOSQ2_000159 [Xanthoceras sorbifolium]
MQNGNLIETSSRSSTTAQHPISGGRHRPRICRQVGSTLQLPSSHWLNQTLTKSSSPQSFTTDCQVIKRIGFKSVFLITSWPYIFSNGYQIRFNEEPCPHCNLGYVVPEWVEENPTLSEIRQIYGSGSTLPTTTLILPLKPDKVNAVKQQLSSVKPKVLLFISKIKRLTVREHNDDPKLNTVSSIAITSETNFLKTNNIDAESFTLHLSAEGDKFDRECSYYMWKQKFPVKQKNKVERRMEVEEWVITLAFPFGFPSIIIQETILFDDKWNQGTLDCVPSAFVNALISLVKMTEDAPVSSLPPMFSFLPVNCCAYQELNAVRESIKAKLVEENIVPSPTLPSE